MQNLSHEYIEAHTLRLDASGRGGGIEIEVTDLFKPTQDGDALKMTAYQNYLGGGMLGAIQSSSNFLPLDPKEKEQLKTYAEDLKKYFHTLTNHDGDEWEEATFEENQRRPESAY